MKNNTWCFLFLLISAHSTSPPGWTRLHTVHHTVPAFQWSAESTSHNVRTKLGRVIKYSAHCHGFWPRGCCCYDEQNSCVQVCVQLQIACFTLSCRIPISSHELPSVPKTNITREDTGKRHWFEIWKSYSYSISNSLSNTKGFLFVVQRRQLSVLVRALDL